MPYQLITFSWHNTRPNILLILYFQLVQHNMQYLFKSFTFSWCSTIYKILLTFYFQLVEHKASLMSSSPHFFHFKVTGLQSIEEDYRAASKQMSDALYLLERVIDQVWRIRRYLVRRAATIGLKLDYLHNLP